MAALDAAKSKHSLMGRPGMREFYRTADNARQLYRASPATRCLANQCAIHTLPANPRHFICSTVPMAGGSFIMYKFTQARFHRRSSLISPMARTRSLAAGIVFLWLAGFSSGAERYNRELWKAPGQVDLLDLYYGSGGQALLPKPPFQFVEKSSEGTNEKVIVRDARNRTWEVKFGSEVKAEVFATRLAWAMGYYTDPTYYVLNGHISYKAFEDARFELRNPALKFRRDLAWSWEENPFSGTRELNGLQILVMLLSDWDNKDARNKTSNTGVLEDQRRRQMIYFVNDWGASMGRWGGFFTREKWDCEEYARQSPKFVRTEADGTFDWGYNGKHGGAFKDSITAADVRWLMQYLGRIRDPQIATALKASGADDHEIQCFTKSVRQRIETLRRIANSSQQTARARPR
jgi:hypothetical protein